MRLCLILTLQCWLACSVPAAELPAGGDGPEGPRTLRIWVRCTEMERDRSVRALEAASERPRRANVTQSQYLLALCQQSFADKGTNRDAFSRGQFPALANVPGPRRASSANPWHASSRNTARWSKVSRQLAGCCATTSSPRRAGRHLGTAADPRPGSRRHAAVVAVPASPPRCRADNGNGSRGSQPGRRSSASGLAGGRLSHARATRRSDRVRSAGSGKPARLSPEEAITNAFDADLRQSPAMVLTPIPAEAPFVRLTIDLRPSDPRLPRTEAVYGWLLGQPGDAYHVLDEYAQERDLPKNRTTFVPTTLAARDRSCDKSAKKARAMPNISNGSRSLSRHGSFSGQFEPGQLRLPEILIGVWAYQRQDKTSAAALLLPRFEELADRRWPREWRGTSWDTTITQQMLTRWANYWDYPGTLRLAKHLTSALFDGYAYEGRAARLLEQVPRRAEQLPHLYFRRRPSGTVSVAGLRGPSRPNSCWTACV